MSLPLLFIVSVDSAISHQAMAISLSDFVKNQANKKVRNSLQYKLQGFIHFEQFFVDI